MEMLRDYILDIDCLYLSQQWKRITMEYAEQDEETLQFREPRLITINTVIGDVYQSIGTDTTKYYFIKGAQNHVSISRSSFCWWYWINGELAIVPLSAIGIVRVVSFAY